MPPRRSERSAPVRPAHAGAAPLNPASSAGSSPAAAATQAAAGTAQGGAAGQPDSVVQEFEVRRVFVLKSCVNIPGGDCRVYARRNHL